ncbi:MAG: 4Fe-4S binding protein, partial [Sphaerochaetaceae bacterium]|nr:4Fe-4S binding protein [Sphaerochaetaceae bacterium]
MAKKVSKLQIGRQVVQVLAFIFFPGLFYLTFMALKNPEGSNLLILLSVFPATILVGRFFCGFLCSFGAMGDLIYYLSTLVMKKRFTISPSVHKVLKYLKFVILGLIVLFCWILGFELDNSYNPWFVFGLRSFGAFLSVGGVILLVIMVLSFFFERFFCRYLCPLGAIFTLLSSFRLFTITKKEGKCVSCGKCSRSCSMGLNVYQKDRVSSGECISCMKCISSCPFKALETPVNPNVACAVAVGTMVAISYAGEVSSIASPTKEDFVIENSTSATFEPVVEKKETEIVHKEESTVIIEEKTP